MSHAQRLPTPTFALEKPSDAEDEKEYGRQVSSGS